MFSRSSLITRISQQLRAAELSCRAAVNSCFSSDTTNMKHVQTSWIQKAVIFLFVWETLDFTSEGFHPRIRSSASGDVEMKVCWCQDGLWRFGVKAFPLSARLSERETDFRSVRVNRPESNSSDLKGLTQTHTHRMRIM